MTIQSDNGRTHEPSLRELTAQVDALKELMSERAARISDRVEERDRLYLDRFRATDEKTTLALNASKEAISKAETATEKRFDAVNEFRGTLSDQAARLLPRAEAEAKFTTVGEKFEAVNKLLDAHNSADAALHAELKDLVHSKAASGVMYADGKIADVRKELQALAEHHRAQIGNLQQGLSATGGQREAERWGRQQSNWSMGQLATVALVAMGWVLTLGIAFYMARGH